MAAGGRYLEENPIEQEAMAAMLAMIVDDEPLSQVAEGLNREGYRNRDGHPWTQTAIFYMMPRLIEVAPSLFASNQWKRRRASGARLGPVVR